MGTSTPRLGDVIDQRIHDFFTKVHGPMPAQVTLVAADMQSLDCKPMVKTEVAGQSVEFPVLRDIPIAWPRTALGVITLPIAIGDSVLVIPSGVALGDWHRLAPGTVADPVAQRRFALGDCVALVGISTALAPLAATAYATGALVVSGADIRLGSSAAVDFVALASLVAAALNRIIAAYNAHTHGGAVPIPVLQLAPEPAPAAITTKAL